MRLQTLAPLLLIVVPALAVEDQKGTDIAAGIDFQVASEKSVYAPYEPVIVKYWIYNRSDQEIRVPGAIAFNAGWVRLDVGAAGGKFQPYYTGSVASGFLGDIRLGPGEK